MPKSVTPVFWHGVHAGALAAAREEGVEIDWQGPSRETDFSRQIQIVEAFIESGVDGIVIAPTNAVSLVPVVEQATNAGVPVTIFDSGINTQNYVSFVATNNRNAGVLAAQKMAEVLDGKGKIAMVRMVPGSASTTDREWGFEEALEEEFPDIEIVAERFCMSDSSRAAAVSEEMLAGHPDLDGMFASAEPATIGAAAALRSGGLGGKVRLVGFDSSQQIENDLKDGVIDAVVVQDPFNIGYTAVKTIIAKLNGESPEKNIESPAQVVTAEDLSRPEIDKLLHPQVSESVN